jgi:predicted CXXCH cytochrome family protein
MGRTILAALLFVVLFPGPLAAAGEKTGDLSVTVAIEGAESAGSLSLVVAGRRVLLEEGSRTHLFEGLPVNRYVVLGESASAQGPRAFGSGVTTVDEGKTAELAVTLRPVDSVEEFCRPCHPGKGDVVEAGQIIRDLHPSGFALEERGVAQVGKYNRNTAQLRKEGKTEKLPIILEKRTVTEKGKKVEREFVVCESCHTVHLDTPFENRTVAPFRDRSDLCVGCHFD